MVKKDELPTMSPEALKVATFVRRQVDDRERTRAALYEHLNTTVRPRAYGYWTDRINGHRPFDLNELGAIATFFGYRSGLTLIAAALDPQL